jgi:hypothetical protein
MSSHARESGNAPAQPHQHAHRDHGPGPLLSRLSFLLGDFEGTGRFTDLDGNAAAPFRKFLSGRQEAGGRFFSLRMSAHYPLADGRMDTHSALVIVGESADGQSVQARAYTDGGETHDYLVQSQGEHFVFADVVPDHGEHWRRARKILVPGAHGFDEILEVALEDSGFVPFYTVALRRVVSPAD